MKLFYDSLNFKQLWAKLPHHDLWHRALPCLLCGGQVTAEQPQQSASLQSQTSHAATPLSAPKVPLCGYCIQALPWYGAPKCPQCALPVPVARHCGTCLQHPPAFDQTLTAFRYAYPLNRPLQQFKYAQQLAYGQLLVDLTRAHLTLQDMKYTPQALVAMPMHPQRLRARGFNHAHFIAQQLEQHWGIPLIPDACRRLSNTPTQAGLDMKTRTQNLRRAFITESTWHGQHLLLVDDVMTTGASMHALANVFKKAGAASVTALVLARTLKPGEDFSV